MIKPFTITDLGYFLPNRFSNPDIVLDQITDPTYEVETLWHDGMVAAILCFKNYWGRCWHGFFLIAEDFPPHLLLVLRRHIRETMRLKNAQRLQTHSVADEPGSTCLEKWHSLLGFTAEGLHRKMLFDKDYVSWALVREGA